MPQQMNEESFERKLAARLKAKGLITRKTIEGKPSLEVTEAGAQLVAKILTTRSIQPVFQSLGKDGIKKLRDALTPLRAVAMHDLGLLDLGEMEFTSPDDIMNSVEVKPAKAKK